MDSIAFFLPSTPRVETFFAAAGSDLLIILLVVASFIFFKAILDPSFRAPTSPTKIDEQESRVCAVESTGTKCPISAADSQPDDLSLSSCIEVNYEPTKQEVVILQIRKNLANGDVASAFAAFQQAEQELANIPSLTVLLLQMLRVCASNPTMSHVRLAWDLYCRTKDSIEYSQPMFQALVHALAHNGDAENADVILRDMTLHNVTPDLNIYSAIIRSHVRLGNLERALQIVNLMKRRGVMPDLVLYQSLLEACVQRDMSFLTETILQDMDAAGIKPSSSTLVAMIRMHTRCGDTEAAFEAFRTYPKRFGIQLHAQVYASLITACVGDGDLSRAFEVYNQMMSTGFIGDAFTCRCLLNACLQDGDLDRASRLIDDAFSNGFHSCLPREGLEIFLQQSVRRGRASELALPTLHRLQKASIFISERVIQAVVRATE